MGCRPLARSVLHCHGVLALRDGPLTGAVQEESQLQEDASKSAGPICSSLPLCFSPAGRSFDRSCAGGKPAARGHGVLALRDGPLTGAVQEESQQQGDASKLEAGSAGRQAN